jgi:hypothetical protein
MKRNHKFDYIQTKFEYFCEFVGFMTIFIGGVLLTTWIIVTALDVYSMLEKCGS